MDLRQALEFLDEYHRLKAVEGMTIEELFAALKVINDPEFSKHQYLKPKIEVILRAKIDAREAVKSQRTDRKSTLGIVLGALGVLLSLLALLLHLLHWL